jgi:bifunctional UDP-N-acetylglucosamine pyrophosphorylase/glucosamine-1-phosphate N-acetyltransferase
MAAGRGSRMKDFAGNKTLLPLEAGTSRTEGDEPILIRILKRLPPGPKAVVVNYKKEDIHDATRTLDLVYCEQPALNGTGGALLAAKDFIKDVDRERLIITMGDVPFVKAATYRRLLARLDDDPLVVLGFRPADKKQYGAFDVVGPNVKRIVEWKYWKDYPAMEQAQLDICNSGIYAARRDDLVRYLDVLAGRPHVVLKERNGEMVEIQEFFITDLVEFMREDDLRIGYVIAEDEDEVLGVDDLASLRKARELYREHRYA